MAGYAEPSTLLAALAPGDRVFMVSMHEPPDRRIALHRAFVDAAIERRIARIVYLSFVGEDETTPETTPRPPRTPRTPRTPAAAPRRRPSRSTSAAATPELNEKEN